MKDLINNLKQLRLTEQQAKEQLATAKLELEQSELYQLVEQCKAYLEVVQVELKEADQQVRDAAISVYNETGNKKPDDKVSIIISKVCEYDEGRATIWAINNALDMLNLDAKKFEKHAKAMADTLPLEFVTIKEEPQARIASKL